MKATIKFIEEFRNKWEGANAATNTISTLMMDRMEEDLKDILTKHEEDILQKDIERLEGMKVTKNELDQAKYSNGHSVQRPEVKQLMEWVNHRTLQTIIDLKRKELEELNEK